jgi:hypothetical protein
MKLNPKLEDEIVKEKLNLKKIREKEKQITVLKNSTQDFFSPQLLFVN